MKAEEGSFYPPTHFQDGTAVQDVKSLGVDHCRQGLKPPTIPASATKHHAKDLTSLEGHAMRFTGRECPKAGVLLINPQILCVVFIPKASIKGPVMFGKHPYAVRYHGSGPWALLREPYALSNLLFHGLSPNVTTVEDRNPARP